MIFVASEKKNSTAKKRDIAPFKVNGFPEILIHMLNQFILASFTDNRKTETYM
jgi:hypothetical protein